MTDPRVLLAFAIHSKPGAYAVLVVPIDGIWCYSRFSLNNGAGYLLLKSWRILDQANAHRS